MEKSLQTKESLKVRRSKRSPGVENTNDQVLIGFHLGNVFWQGKKNFGSLFLVEKFTYTSDTYFFVFSFPHRDPTEGREWTGSRMKTSVRLTRDSKSQSHTFSREKIGMSALRRGKKHTG